MDLATGLDSLKVHAQRAVSQAAAPAGGDGDGGPRSFKSPALAHLWRLAVRASSLAGSAAAHRAGGRQGPLSENEKRGLKAELHQLQDMHDRIGERRSAGDTLHAVRRWRLLGGPDARTHLPTRSLGEGRGVCRHSSSAHCTTGTTSWRSGCGGGPMSRGSNKRRAWWCCAPLPGPPPEVRARGNRWVPCLAGATNPRAVKVGGGILREQQKEERLKREKSRPPSTSGRRAAPWRTRCCRASSR